MVDESKNLLDERFKPDGYNVGINFGADAGQTVMHCHIHSILRRSGDSISASKKSQLPTSGMTR